MTCKSGTSEIRLLDRDVKMKIWVPESVYGAITLLADVMEISRGEWARYALIAHAFGRWKLERAIIEKASEPQPLFSRRSVSFSLPEPDTADIKLPLGKSTVDSVVLVAEEVYAATKRLAGKANVPLGTYASYVLCWATFGHGVHTSMATPLTAGYLVGDFGDDTPAQFGTDG